MFGYKDKRVTVRFTEKEAAAYEELFGVEGLFGWYKKANWTNLIHEALKEMRKKHIEEPLAKRAAELSDKAGGSAKSSDKSKQKVSKRLKDFALRTQK